jgi:hypothetical protein
VGKIGFLPQIIHAQTLKDLFAPGSAEVEFRKLHIDLNSSKDANVLEARASERSHLLTKFLYAVLNLGIGVIAHVREDGEERQSLAWEVAKELPRLLFAVVLTSCAAEIAQRAPTWVSLSAMQDCEADIRSFRILVGVIAECRDDAPAALPICARAGHVPLPERLSAPVIGVVSDLLQFRSGIILK